MTAPIVFLVALIATYGFLLLMSLTARRRQPDTLVRALGTLVDLSVKNAKVIEEFNSNMQEAISENTRVALELSDRVSALLDEVEYVAPQPVAVATGTNGFVDDDDFDAPADGVTIHETDVSEEDDFDA